LSGNDSLCSIKRNNVSLHAIKLCMYLCVWSGLNTASPDINKMIYYARNDMYKGSKKIICVYLLLLAFIPSVVLAETSDDWEFGLSIYGWFPDIGGQDWPVDVTAAVNFDMKSLIWTNAAYYRLLDEPKASFDLLGGVRYASIKQSLDWSFSGDIGQLPVPGREGSAVALHGLQLAR
jgi:hypothetical protein